MINKKVLFFAAGILAFLYPFAGIAADHYSGRTPYGYNMQKVLDVTSDENVVPVGEILDGDTIRQYFITDCDCAAAIKVSTATYARQNQGVLTARLIEAQGQDTVKTWETDLSKMADNSYISLDFSDTEPDLSGKKYVLEITSKGAVSGNAVTLYACQDDVYPDGYLEINGKQQSGDLRFQILKITGKKSFVQTKLCLRIYLAAVTGIILYVVYTKLESLQRKNRDNEKTMLNSF